MSEAAKKKEESFVDGARTVTKDLQVTAQDLVKTVKELVREGNVRRITVKNKEGATVASFPLVVGVVGVTLAPMLAALGALSAMLTECTLTIEKTE
jgi:hypothetical protein